MLALFEAGIEPPARLIGVSVGALNAATVAAYPTVAGAGLLRELWFSPWARGVFRAHPIGIMLNRLRGERLSTIPVGNLTRLLQRAIRLMGMDSFERLRVPLEVLATDIGAGRAQVFRSGQLLPALLASTAIPGVFPAVHIDGTSYLDGGIVDNLPITLAAEEGGREILGIELMAGGELHQAPATWGELMARTLQLSMHQRMLSDFERIRRRARVVVISPVLGPGDGVDMTPRHVEELLERTRRATLHLLRQRGRRLFRESGVHYLDLSTQESHSVA